MSNTFFTSDLHFFHKNIIEFCNRPYTSVEDMNKKLVENWNNKVSATDKVYVLGDVSFGKPVDTLEVLAELKGHIYLVPGNHDRKGRTTVDDLSALWKILPEYSLLKLSPTYKFVLSHFPFHSWERGWVNLHGHTHGTYPSKYMQHDVGVDVNDYVPISAEEAYTKAMSEDKSKLLY